VPRSVDATRDLLFGTLTLQVGLIDQGQLAAALHDWVRARDRPLADHLAARGDLDADQRAAVEAMVALHLKKHGGDAERSLAAMPAFRSTIATLPHAVDAGIDVPPVDLGLAATQADDRSNGAGTSVLGSATSDWQRFRVLRAHARGGWAPSSSRSTPSCTARWPSSKSLIATSMTR
jgi:eukaryotic-like serine/threonine-protein kinase